MALYQVDRRPVALAIEIVVADADLVDEAERQRVAGEPDVAVADLGDGDFRPEVRHHALEGVVRLFELVLKMLAARWRDLAEYRHAALELARRHHFDVNVVLLQSAVEIGDLGDDADRANHRERRGDDAV